MGALQDSFVQKVKAGDWNNAADLLNGMSMADMLASLKAMGGDCEIAANNISGLLRKRGWVESAQRIEFVGEALRRKSLPNPPPGLADDQVAAVRAFLSGGGRSGPNADGRYTDDPNEVSCVQTIVSAQTVMSAMKLEWPALSVEGLRTLASQFLFETAGGQSCFNWNLGGTKATDSQVHFYMTTFECWVPAVYQNEVKTGGRLPTPDEQKKFRCKDGKSILMYDPPHPMSRFKSSPSLAVSVHGWVGHQQYIGYKHPGYVDLLNAGDIPAVVAVLSGARYFTGDPGLYRTGMEVHKKAADKINP